MTEFEAATLALQQTSLWVGIAQAGVAGAVGLLQAAVVGWGIRQMTKMGDRREQQHADRHEETMLVLRTLIERTAQRQAHAVRL